MVATDSVDFLPKLSNQACFDVPEVVDISLSDAKTFTDFNPWAVVGSAVGSGLASGLTAPFGQSLGQQLSAASIGFGPATAGAGIGGQLGQADSASGGFVLYPSKPNTNMLRSVYAK